MLNGARLPNWVWILALGFQAGGIWAGQKAAVNEVKQAGEASTKEIVEAIRANTERDSTRELLTQAKIAVVVAKVDTVDETVRRRTEQINWELDEISRSLPKPRRSRRIE